MTNYCDNIISDLHKDARGYRPRRAFMEMWNESTPQTKQEVWDMLCEEMDLSQKEQKRAEIEALSELRINLREVMNTCHCNWKKALVYLADAEGEDIDHDEQTFDFFLWKQGIGYDDCAKIRKMYMEQSNV